MWLHELAETDNEGLFKDDASFIKHEDRFFEDENTISFESTNFPNFFVRHCNFRLQINEYEDSDLYHNDASFIIVKDGGSSSSSD